ncbi:MAG TPA: hypothetical protein VGH29_20010 [Candidatus Binataceae bacterium]|jgi:hypothetical protein
MSDADTLKKFKAILGDAPKPPAETTTGAAGATPPEDQGVVTRGLEAAHEFVGAHDPLASTEQEMGRGVAKSVAGTATGIPRAANAALGLIEPSMSRSLGDLAERVPGVKRMEEFAAEPSQSWSETAGYLGGAGTQLLAGPAALPGRFVPGRGFVPATRAQQAGNVGKSVIGGAAGGAMADPENPSAGALTGAATGGLAPLAGAALKSRPAQYMAGHYGAYGLGAALTAIGEAVGIPAHYLWMAGVLPLIERYHSPTSRAIRAGTKATVGGTGTALERASPRAVGATAGEAERLAE